MGENLFEGILVIDGPDDLDYTAFTSHDSFLHKELIRFREFEDHFAEFAERATGRGVHAPSGKFFPYLHFLL